MVIVKKFDYLTVGRGTLILMIGRMLTLILSFIALGLVTRLLGSEKYGIFSFVIGIAALFSVFMSFGVSAGIYGVPYLSLNRECEAKDIFYKIFKIFFLLGVVSSILLLAGSLFLQSGLYVICIIPYIFFFLLATVFSSILYYLNNFHFYILGDISMNLSLILLLFYLVKEPSLLGCFLAYSLSALITFVLLLLITHLIFLKNIVKKPTKESIWELFRYPIPYFSSQLLRNLNSRIGVFILTYYSFLFGMSEVGYFNLACSLVMYGGLFIFAISDAIGPTITKFKALGEKNKIQDTIVEALKYSFILAVPIIFSLPSLAEPLVILFFKKEFFGASLNLVILGFMLFFMILKKTFAGVLMLYESSRFLFFGELTCLILLLPTSFVLIPSYSSLGASIALLLGTFASAIVYVSKSLSLGFKLPIKKLSKLIIPGVIFFLLYFVPQSFLFLFLAEALLLVFYLLFLYFLKEINRTDIRRIMNLCDIRGALY